MLGGHAIGVNRVSFDGCLVPEIAMLAGPGAGFRAAMQGIDFARTVLSAMCCGILRDSLDCALAYAAERQAFGRPVAGFQGLQWQLADVATDLEAARLLTYEAARLLDGGGPATAAAAHAKKFSSRVALAGIVQCMQAMGAAGLRSQWPFGRHLAGAKIAQYLDGTTEIQNVVLSRALLERYGIR
jgi:alkylation response protein AidB-like acyl-CoA dehydrogenase